LKQAVGPETKRHYQLGMIDQVREGIEQANKRAFEARKKYYVFTAVRPEQKKKLPRRP